MMHRLMPPGETRVSLSLSLSFQELNLHDCFGKMAAAITADIRGYLNFTSCEFIDLGRKGTLSLRKRRVDILQKYTHAGVLRASVEDFKSFNAFFFVFFYRCTQGDPTMGRDHLPASCAIKRSAMKSALRNTEPCIPRRRCSSASSAAKRSSVPAL